MEFMAEAEAFETGFCLILPVPAYHVSLPFLSFSPSCS